MVPDVKMVILLRNPVERAWSQYWNEVGKGRERLRFEEAIEHEEDRAQRSDYALFHLAYLRRGYYATSLASLYTYFSPDQVLGRTPGQTLQQIYHFIGVDASVGLDLAGNRFNANWTMLPRRWTTNRFVMPLTAAYTRLAEAIIVRSTQDTERRRTWRKIVKAPIRRSVHTLHMPAEVRAKLNALYAPHIQKLEENIGFSIPEWQE